MSERAPVPPPPPARPRPLIDSIAARLLRIIFGCYFLVTVVVTGTQLAAEYRHTEDKLLREIDAMQQTFGPGISDAMWRYNDDILGGILAGMRALPAVEGVKIENDAGQIVHASGAVSNRAGKALHADAKGRLTPAKADRGVLEMSIRRAFPIVYTDEAGKDHSIGSWTVYSNRRLVLQQVQYGFVLILVNSVIKTVALWFIFLYVVERWLGRPLRQLSDFVGELNIDNLGNTVFMLKDRGRHELHVLAHKLNEMAAGLRHAVAEKVELNAQLQAEQAKINRLNESLEIRVSERTADLLRDRQQLAQANESLEKANRDLATALDTLHRAHQELGRSERLAALGSLVAGVAHELNTPIGNSLTAASTLTERTQEFSDKFASGLTKSSVRCFIDDTSLAADLITRNIVRSANLVTSFKQVAVDQTSAQRRGFDLAEVVTENIKALSPMIRKTAYVVELQVARAIRMDSYPGPLGQVIMNLVNNAILHGFEGRNTGTITIASAPADALWTVLCVSDNGLGIPGADLPRIFDPFFTTKLGTGGCGLGLSITHNIVTGLLGGRIEVASVTGAGSTFTLTLPLTAPREVVPD